MSETQDRIYDLEWLDGQQGSLHDAVRRLDFPSVEAVRKFCEYHNLDALYVSLRDRSDPGSVVRVLHPNARAIPDRSERDWATSAELVAETGITYRQLDYWTRTKLLKPIGRATPGSGYQRRFSDAQVARARVLRALLDAGVAVETCRRIIDDITATGTATDGLVTFTIKDGAA